MTDEEKVKLYDACKIGYDKLPKTNDLFEKTLYELICYFASDQLRLFTYREINNPMKLAVVDSLLKIVNKIRVFNDPKGFSDIAYLLISIELNYSIICNFLDLIYFPKECLSNDHYGDYTFAIENILIFDNYNPCKVVSHYKVFEYITAFFEYKYDHHLGDAKFAPELILYCTRNDVPIEKFNEALKYLFDLDDYLMEYWELNSDYSHDEELDVQIVKMLLDGSINNREIR